MDLHEFNTRLLGSLNIIDESGEGHLSRRVGESLIPFTVNGKRVLLPTAHNLRTNVKDTLIYHPLSENITRSESDMIKALRDTVMYELTMRSAMLLTELARVAATPSEHKRLDPSSSKYLKDLPDMDEKTYLFLKEKLLMRVGAEPEKRLVSITLRKGDQRDGVLRRCMFKFPVLEALLSNEPTILGVKYPSQKARNTLRVLFQLVLGDEEVRAGYDYGSKNLTAPYFHALLSGFANMAQHLNGVIKKHKKLLGSEQVEDLTFDLSWLEALDDLPELRKTVPPQEGNEGAIIVSEGKPAETTSSTKKVAERLLPADRRSAPAKASEEDDDTPPWEDSRPTTRRVAAEPERPRSKTLDDYLSDSRGHRSDRDDWGRRRDDRRSSRFARDDDRDYGRGRRIDLGLGGDRDRDRGRDDRRFNSRGRDDRGFGQGHRNHRGSF